jgi:hypothetical protein
MDEKSNNKETNIKVDGQVVSQDKLDEIKNDSSKRIREVKENEYEVLDKMRG